MCSMRKWMEAVLQMGQGVGIEEDAAPENGHLVGEHPVACQALSLGIQELAALLGKLQNRHICLCADAQGARAVRQGQGCT